MKIGPRSVIPQIGLYNSYVSIVESLIEYEKRLSNTSFSRSCLGKLETEDHELNADAAEMRVILLRQDGDEVRLAREVLTALQVVHDFEPQVVLCDLGLPRLSGFEVAMRLREQPECRGTMLVALKGYGRDEDRRQSQLAGFDHHLTKPVDPEVLAALIQQRRLL